MEPDENETSRTDAPQSGAGPSFPARVIAGLLEITDRRLQQLANEGWIARPVRGQYNLRDSVRGYIRYLKQHARENTRGNETSRLARAQATKVEMENFRRMGELAAWPQVDDLMHGLVVQVRTAHEGIPGRLASELAGITDPPKIYQRLQSELRGVDNLLADYLEKCADSLGAMPQPGASATTFDPHHADEVGSAEPDDAAGLSGAG
jgi:phage terminase Nu1 subunit (DNA packaging protein)